MELLVAILTNIYLNPLLRAPAHLNEFEVSLGVLCSLVADLQGGSGAPAMGREWLNVEMIGLNLSKD